MNEWYELILEDYKNLGIEKFTELVDDAEYYNFTERILHPTREMWDWDEFDLIHKIFKEIYV